MYLVDLLDVYGPGIAILFVVLVEAVGVCWCYGTVRFSNDIQSMLGFRPGPFWRITWAYISPLFLLVCKLTVHNKAIELALLIDCCSPGS